MLKASSMSYIVSRCMLLYWLLKGIQLEDTNHQAVEFYLLRLSLAAETGRMWQGTSALSRPHMSSTALKETKPQLNNFLNLPKLTKAFFAYKPPMNSTETHAKYV